MITDTNLPACPPEAEACFQESGTMPGPGGDPEGAGGDDGSETPAEGAPDGGAGDTVADAGGPPADDPGGGGSGGGYGGPPGCDGPSGECDEWETALLQGVGESQRMHGCDGRLVLDERLDAVASRHAQHQAEVDALDPNARAVFSEVYETDLVIFEIGAAFSVTREGPQNVLERWADNPRTAPLLERCDAVAGVGIRTSRDGDSYVTLILAH